jgi:prepilin-type N-terminal cleavage/methylation domain-containing protein
MTHTSQGYTLVEMLVAMAVTSIVLAGTYAAYAFFSQQQQSLLAQTEVDRSALRTIDLMQSDIRMAGFKDYLDINPMPASQAIVLASNMPGDVRFVYDDYDNVGNLYRALVRYYTASFTSSTGVTRNRLLREWRKCNNPSQACDLSNSSPLTGSLAGEPVLDWVSNFTVTGMNQKATGSFATQYQTIQVNLVVDSPKKIEGTTRKVSKSFTFLARAKNVSLVP